MRSAFAFLLLAATAWGAVDGTVINGSTGKPQPDVAVTLVNLSAGMAPVGTVQSDAQGRFRFEQQAQGPHLLQASFEGVTYSLMLSPGSPMTGLTLEIFHASSRPAGVKVTQDMLLLEPVDNQLFVSENLIFQNDGKFSYNDPANGTLRVFVPEAAQGEVRIMATSPGGMPIQRAAEGTSEPNVRKIDFPIKPGETRFEVSYVVPFSRPGVYSGRVIQKDSPLRLVVPAGVSLKGDGLQNIGQEPHTQAAIYEVNGREYKVEIEGTGTLRAAGEVAEEESGPTIEQILPKLYRRVYWIVGLGLAILLLGFVLLYRASTTGPQSSRPPAAPEPKDKHR